MQELAKKDHKLQEHIQEMKRAVIRSRAGSTNRSYSSWFKCFQVFCEKLNMPLVMVGVPEAAFLAQSICREGFGFLGGSSDVSECLALPDN